MQFAKIFTGRTMRMDTFHSGTAGKERFAVDRIRVEGPWAGRTVRLDQDLGLGKYRCRIKDRETGAILFVNGYCSIFGEWETTAEASGGSWKTFSEPFLFPEPRKPFTLLVEKRQRDGSFLGVWETHVDPESRFVDRSPVRNDLEIWTVFENGPASNKVDLLFMGDGYTGEETEKFREDVRRMTETIFSAQPFARRKKDFNVRAIDVVSQDSGLSDPRRGSWRNTALGLRFNSLDLDRYVLSFDEKSIRDAAASAPYDFILILFNDVKYGGGGIYNLWLTCSSDSSRAPYVIVHEFGHLLAGLADEYYSSDVAYENFESEPAEPWEPNVTAMRDPASLKWKDLVDPDTPLPTPWEKAEYEDVYSGSQPSPLSSDEKSRELLRLVREGRFAGKVGAFEGAAYHSTGYYRPEQACIMFSTHTDEGFCRVCTRAIEQVIDLHCPPGAVD